jgi:hypothetical protein
VGGLCHRLSPFQALGKVTLPCVVRPACLFTVHVGSGSSLLSQASLLLVAGRAPLPPEPLRPARLIYFQSREGFPSPNLQRSWRPTLFPSCLNCSYCLVVSFSFFSPRVEVSLSRGLCCSGPSLSVGLPRYREAHLVRVFPSRMGAGHWRPGGLPRFSV